MGSINTFSGAPPILDFADFYTSNSNARAELIQNINQACRNQGFFQLTNTQISSELRERIIQASREFFDLSLEEKLKCDMKLNDYHRGYEVLDAQRLEPGAAKDSKEAVYFGEDLHMDHPRVVAGEYNCGPNIYPPSLDKNFSRTIDEYYIAARNLAQDIMKALALGLDLGETYFDDFCLDRSHGTLRLIHYPPTPQTGPLERGVGAHRDWGCITILLQDAVGGLQVQDEKTGEWLDVVPVPDAFVVNMGNTMMRWSNHHFTSGTHRVMNLTHSERYSVPFFFNGNTEKMIETLPGCEKRKETSDRPFGPPLDGAKYEPIKLKDYMLQQFTASYESSMSTTVS